MVAGLMAALMVAAPAHAADRCHPAGARTQARTALVRVYRLHGQLFGCRRDGGRPQLVTVRHGWGPVDATGTDVAVALGGCDNLGCASQLRVVRVRRDGATPIRTVRTTNPRARVASLLVAGAATLAWSECEPDPFGDYLCGPGGDSVESVWVSSRRTPVPVRLDRGRNVVPRSVRLAHGRVHWRNGRRHASAPIP